MSHSTREITGLATRSEVVLTADPKRVLARLFVPGHEQLLDHESRASGVLARILALPEDVVCSTLRQVHARYDGRHRDLPGVLLAHYEQIAHRVPGGATLTDERRSLVGAWFTHEFAVEGAALFNPSAVAHPDQSNLPAGHCRFLLSLRAVGEGHLSCVEFRTGVLGPGRDLRIDDPGPHIETGRTRPTPYDRELFAAKLTEEGADAESASYLLRCLPPRFDERDLERALAALSGQRVTRQGGPRTGELARRIARCSYEVEFSPLSGIAERVLWPHAPSESRGIEDARFVRFVDEDGSAVYRATYTAFDGEQIAPQVIETSDFRSFRMSQLAGPAAKNKGMALFPRKVGGRYVALSRWDRENSAITTSADGRWWGDPRTLHAPSRPWELIQTGNCGSPVETEAGWLVLTHGVGPMREYAIGALLLDLDDPSRVIGGLRDPLMSPVEDERDGYVPNVVYSCGALLHGDQLLLPYGASDSSVRFAFVDVPLLLDRLTSDGPPATMRANRSA
jgi:predicted GH43/DUF377 family glycosyl hydrolase